MLTGDSSLTIARNLTLEIGGTTELTWENPHIAYSTKQKKLYLIYTTRGDGNNGEPLWFTVSTDAGTTWSQPSQIATLTGYRPAESDLIIDSQGLVHVFWGQDDSTPATIQHKYQDANGVWTSAEIAGSGDRPIFTQSRLAPDGDIFLSWYDGGPGISRWNHTTGQWTDLTPNLGALIHATTAQLPTITIGKDNTLWLMWINAPYGGSDNEFIAAAVSQDNGLTWSLPEAVLHTTDALIGRITSMEATSSKGLIYLSFVADSKDPNHTSGSTLFLQTVIDTNKPDYATTPGATITATQSSTPTATSQANPTIINNSPTAYPTYTPYPTYTIGATATSSPTAYPTYTPVATYTPYPTYTPVPATPTATAIALAVQPPPTSTPTATATPTDQGFQVAPTPVAVPATKGSSGSTTNIVPNQAQNNQPNQPTANGNTITPVATSTVNPIVPAAGSIQQAGSLTAAAPILIPLPTALANVPRASGIGPKLELPTATATVKPTLTPTAKPTATASTTASPTATAQTVYVTPGATAIEGGAAVVTNTNTITSTTDTVTNTATVISSNNQNNNSTPPAPGPFLFLPIGIIAGGRGILTLINLLALKHL